MLQSSDAVRHAYLSWLNHVQGGVQMNMVATKPVRYVGTHEPIGPLRRLPRTLAAAAACARIGVRAGRRPGRRVRPSR